MIPLLDAGLQILDKVIPDPKARDEAKRRLLELRQQGELQEIEAQLSAIIAEAESEDPWTSRARPTFLYVVYVLLLWGLPMGFWSLADPTAAERFTAAFGAWFAAIPEPIITLFGVGYLGYTGARSLDKRKK